MTYFLSAYATNSVGTTYGDELSFTTLQAANVEGYTYYAGSTIPVSGVTVSINEINYTTGSTGYYELNNVPIGNQTITATKPDYDPFSQSINIPPEGIEVLIEMTSGVYTHNVFGTIINQVYDPISEVYVIVLNPDGTESDLATTSSSSGYYQIPSIPQGQRTIRFIKEICEPYEIVIFMANSDYQLDVELLEYDLPCPGYETVQYEGQIYNTVLIGDKCWFKENLNVGIMIDGDESMEDNEIIEKYCYGNDLSNCNSYGALYQWDEMMQYVTTPGTQGICPSGWHIPTDDEWKILEGTVDSQYGVGDPEWDDTGLRGFDAGFHLKSTTGWNSNGNGDDSFGFAALPGGARSQNGGFTSLGYHALFWSSAEGSGSYPLYRDLHYYDDGVSRYINYETYGFSARCLQDWAHPDAHKTTGDNKPGQYK